jgi:hypothetical protein
MLVDCDLIHTKLKNAVLWDVTPCGSFKKRRFEETYRLHHEGGKNRLLVTANVSLTDSF